MRSSKKGIFVIKPESNWLENKHNQEKYQQNQELHLQKTKDTNSSEIHGYIKKGKKIEAQITKNQE